MKTLILVISTIFCVISFSYGQSAHSLKKDGDEAYENEDFIQAEEKYRKAIDTEADGMANYNLGNTLYNQERYEEAEYYFDRAAASLKDNEKLQAYFNQGNSLLKQKKYDETIEAYKKALEINENDVDVRKNLSYAQGMKKMEKMMQEQQEQFQEQQEQREEKERQEQQGQVNEQESDDQQQQQQQESEKESESQEENEGEEEQSSQGEEENEQESSAAGEEQKEGELSKEEALKLLEIIEDEEQKVQEKLRKIDGKKKKPEKDW